MSQSIIQRINGCRRRWACLAAGLLAVCSGPVLASPIPLEEIDLLLDSPRQTYYVGETVEVTVLADVPSPLVGFGFDLETGDELNYVLFDVDDAFVGVATPDGDGMAGLSFAGGVQGAGLPLGVARFLAVNPGNVTITLTTTEEDLTEGFARWEAGFFAYESPSLDLTILPPDGGGGGGGGEGPPVPEPATLFLLALGALSLSVRRGG